MNNAKDRLIYHLHNLGRCERGYLNGIIKDILTVNDKTSEIELIALKRSINELVFEYGISFGDEYPNSADNFIKELRS